MVVVLKYDSEIGHLFISTPINLFFIENGRHVFAHLPFFSGGTRKIQKKISGFSNFKMSHSPLLGESGLPKQYFARVLPDASADAHASADAQACAAAPAIVNQTEAFPDTLDLTGVYCHTTDASGFAFVLGMNEHLSGEGTYSPDLLGVDNDLSGADTHNPDLSGVDSPDLSDIVVDPCAMDPSGLTPTFESLGLDGVDYDDFPLDDTPILPLMQSIQEEKFPSPSSPIPPKKKRGRPKGKTNAKRHISNEDRENAVAFAALNPGVPNPFLGNPVKKAKIEKDPNVFRSFATYPKYLMDPEVVRCLDFMNEGTPEIRQAILSAAESKLNQVLSGATVFGERVLIKSFKPIRPPFTMVASPQNLFLWHVLLGRGVMTTRHGMVSVFPVTVYNSEKNFQKHQQGFPCLVVHIGHIKTLMWRIFSCCRNMPISNETLSNQCHYQMEYDVNDDAPLITLSGFDAYHIESHKQLGGFLLFSAEYVDVMKHFFVTPTRCLRDIGTILSLVYRHIPELTGKFTDEFRCLWLGEEREPNVRYMLGDPTTTHAFSMSRARSLSGIVGFGRTGKRWSLPLLTNEPSEYRTNSFAYGVQCWDYQLRLLNSAYVYFTGESIPMCQHQWGLLELDPITPVQGRSECIEAGLLNDFTKYATSPALRRARSKLVKTYGTDFVRNFFGAEHVRVYQKRKSGAVGEVRTQ